MKSRLSIAVVVLALAFLALGATDPAHGHNNSIAQLKDRVVALERRVEILEKKLRAATAQRRSAAVRPRQTPRRPSRPKGWRRKEFNGIPYYIIPVERKPSTPTQRTR